LQFGNGRNACQWQYELPFRPAKPIFYIPYPRGEERQQERAMNGTEHIFLCPIDYP
jgi:hypothetical protein